MKYTDNSLQRKPKFSLSEFNAVFRDEINENFGRYFYLFFLIFIFSNLVWIWSEKLYVSSLHGINILIIYSIAVLIMFIAKYAGSVFYTKKMWSEHKPHRYPRVDVIVPAFNEGESIYSTIKSIARSDYPKSRLKIVVVNDGSTDNTSFFVKKAIKDFGKKNDILFFNEKKNRGKRSVLTKSIKSTNGEIIVLVDSDSFVHIKGLKEIVKPLLINKKIGAVAAHTRVYNSGTNLLTRMQEVQYFNAFRATKAVESLLGMVTCCPGCFSAYRRSALMPILTEWSEQKFLGVKCTYGEDRGLTNLILRSGFNTVYCQNAEVSTIVPDKFMSYVKQQLRWKKSFLRENMVMITYLWKRNYIISMYVAFERIVAPIGAVILFTLLLTNLLFANKGFPYIYILALSYSLIILCQGLYYKVNNPHKKSWLFGAACVTLFQLLLMYQLPYAIITTRNSGWGTR